MYLERLSLKGRHALVTGGGRGIGLACAEALCEAGASIVIADAEAAVLAEGQATLAAKGAQVDARLLDVTDQAAIEALAEEFAASERRIDILVNNAGIARSGTPAEAVSDELWRNVLDVNLNGTFWCCRAFPTRMLAKGGAVVNVGSMGGLIIVRPQTQTYYNTSKAAVHHLTKSLAAEWAPRGVRINAVAPTYIDTPLNDIARANPAMYATWLENTPMGRMGRPDEVASTVLFLASDAARVRSSLWTAATPVGDELRR